jgi:hypothetical protein
MTADATLGFGQMRIDSNVIELNLAIDQRPAASATSKRRR